MTELSATTELEERTTEDGKVAGRRQDNDRAAAATGKPQLMCPFGTLSILRV